MRFIRWIIFRLTYLYLHLLSLFSHSVRQRQKQRTETHTVTENYACPSCGNPFSLAKQHPFTCPVCGKHLRARDDPSVESIISAPLTQDLLTVNIPVLIRSEHRARENLRKKEEEKKYGRPERRKRAHIFEEGRAYHIVVVNGVECCGLCEQPLSFNDQCSDCGLDYNNDSNEGRPFYL